MGTPKSTPGSVHDPELVNAMGACLRIILDDIRAQYRHAAYEAERLKKAGVAVYGIFDTLGLPKPEYKKRYGSTNPDRRVQRT